jgi:ABC-2 type transport system ATP-binding protein
MIKLRDVSFYYREQEPVLGSISLSIPSGLTLVLGPNGAGKSTFLKVVAGIERPDSGTVSVCGHDLWSDELAARRGLAYVPEQPDLTPYATINDILRLVCLLRGEPAGAVREVMERAGLRGLERRSIRELSMGQRRRAVLAAAWLGSPSVLILDEPLEAMDREMRESVVSWTRRAVSDGAAALVATHDIEPFAALASQALAFRDGKCRSVDRLPADLPARLSLFESLSRGRDAR